MDLLMLSTDPVLSQIAVNALLDVVWPLLPPEVLEQLAYV